jgi:ABC-type nitrate/sulfonate/bicarbonate transport system substrate-binding protein
VKTISLRKAVCSLILSAAALAGHAQTVPTVRFAALADPLLDAAVYALQQGLVTSDKVKVEYRPLPVPGLVEALNSRQFEIIQAGVTVVPKLAAAGAPIRIVGMDFTSVGEMATYAVLVRSDSNIRSLADLRGRSMAVGALGATNTFQLRAILQQKHGINTFKGKPDVDLKQVPLPTMPTLLRNKDVDAAYVYYSVLYPVLGAAEFRNLGSPQKEFSDVFKTKSLIALKVSFDPILSQRGAEVKAALDLLEESRKYYENNPGPIEEVIAKRNNVDRAYLEWSRKNTFIGGPMQREQLAADLQAQWSIAAQLGEIKVVPDVRKLIWTP